MPTMDSTETGAAQDAACEVCGVRERIAGDDPGAGMHAVALLERRAESGETWRLCVVCQIAVALLENGDDQELPSA